MVLCWMSPSAISITSTPRISTRRPVGAMPWNGPPVKVPAACHWTTAVVSSATILSAVMVKSGKAANSSRKKARTASCPRISPTATKSSTYPGAPVATMPSGSCLLTASKAARATSAGVRVAAELIAPPSLPAGPARRSPLPTIIPDSLPFPGPGCQHVGVDLAESKALVRRYYDEVLTGRDRQLLARLLDPSFVSHVSGGPDAGAEAYIAAVGATHAAFPDLVVTVHDQVAEDDKVVTRWSATGTHA